MISIKNPIKWPESCTPPFIIAGCIGNVTSEAKEIQTGMIGSKKMPAKTIPTDVMLKLP